MKVKEGRKKARRNLTKRKYELRIEKSSEIKIDES